MKRFMILPLLLVSILAVTQTMALAQDDPVEILKKHKAAMEQGDVDAALALYADDAAIEGGGSCRWVSPCVGKAAIRSHLEQRVKNKHRKVTVIADYPSGNFLTRQVEIRDKRTRKARVDRIIAWGITKIKDGKILFRRGFRDRSDPQTARYIKWRREQRRTHAR